MPQATVWAQQSQSTWEVAKNRSLDWIYETVRPNPLVGSVGGEWAVIALARADRVTATDPWVVAWLNDLERTLLEVDSLKAQGHDINNPPSAGTFPSAMRRWTDFQRVTLALSALGIDASDFNGRDLTAIYSTFVPVDGRHALNMTINVDTFALIALDSKSYSGDRDQFIEWLLEYQRINGAWGLGGFELDVTAMAVAALAPYYHSDIEIAIAIDNALEWLDSQTFPDVESTAQMIVALTTLGEDFAEEAYYYVNWLLRWFDEESGAFRRPNPNSPINLMATEQGAYALVAYWRFVNGMTPLYDMSDMLGDDTTVATPISAPIEDAIGLPNKHEDVTIRAITLPERSFDDITSHANREAIEALASREIVSGRTENTFAPDQTMTRAEFAAIVSRGLGLPNVNIGAFEDVSPSAWYFGAVGTAFFYEIVSGVSDTEFNPSGTITRQEAATMVARAARLAGLDTQMSNIEILNILAKFGDYREASNWAFGYLAFCFREGILDEYEFYIRPTEPATRGEVAQMLYNLLAIADLA